MARLPRLSRWFGLNWKGLSESSSIQGKPVASLGIGQVTGPAVAAVLCTVVVAQHHSSRLSEVSSEALCWVILPILFAIAKRSDADISSRAALSDSLIPNAGPRPASPISLWTVAICVTAASCYRAEIGAITLLPALTPLLLKAEKQLRARSELQAPWFFSALVNSVLGTALVALFAILTVSDWKLGWSDPKPRESDPKLEESDWGVGESVLSTLPVAALLLVYVALTPRIAERPRFLPCINIEEDIRPLSLRIVVLLVAALGLQTAVFGLPSNGISPSLFIGFAKALSWYFTIQTTRHSSWCIATAMATFSVVANTDPFTLSSEVQALSQVFASFLTLGQIVHMLPKQATARSALWVCILVSLVPYLANIFAIRNAKASVPPSFGHSQKHPVEALMHKGKADLERLLQTQSKNYTAADREYRRRYGIEPPPGFKAWYEFAIANQSPIIDDFDTIFDAVSPFWTLSGSEVVKMMGGVQAIPNVDLWHCTFSGESGKTQCSHPQRTFDRHYELLFNTLLKDRRGVLPDVNFRVNHLDQPRVLIPPKSLSKGNSDWKGELRVADMSRQPSWDIVMESCKSQQNDRGARAENTVETFGLPFVTDRSSDMDLCRHPEYSGMYGLFMSPSSFGLIEGMAPIFSTGSPSTMGDVLFPSPAYIESEFVYDEANDIPWERKSNNLYWVGSTTGAFAIDDQWGEYHRQRFVKLAQNLERQEHYYLREQGGVVSRVKSWFLNGRLFDVSFARIFQCEQRYCRDQRAFFKVKTWAHKDQALRSRLVFDLDGNGISGRYYKLLASNSVPLKQTLLREWHDERLVPWVHYIPVSQSMEELPELIFYLTSTEAGQQRAQEIAELGRDWFSKAFREVDMAVYTYRLLLEMARLQDLERQAT